MPLPGSPASATTRVSSSDQRCQGDVRMSPCRPHRAANPRARVASTPCPSDVPPTSGRAQTLMPAGLTSPKLLDGFRLQETSKSRQRSQLVCGIGISPTRTRRTSSPLLSGIQNDYVNRWNVGPLHSVPREGRKAIAQVKRGLLTHPTVRTWRVDTTALRKGPDGALEAPAIRRRQVDSRVLAPGRLQPTDAACGHGGPPSTPTKQLALVESR